MRKQVNYEEPVVREWRFFLVMLAVVTVLITLLLCGLWVIESNCVDDQTTEIRQ